MWSFGSTVEKILYDNNGLSRTQRGLRSFNTCCGMHEMGMFLKHPKKLPPDSAYVPIKGRDNFLEPFCGLFVTTYTKTQADEGLEDELNKYHTLQYQSDFNKNTGPQAGDHEDTGGVRVAVYKWGK